MLNDSFDEQRSDIDLLVELDTQDPIARGQNLMNLWEQFEGFFKRKVDLLTNSSIKNPILRKHIDASKILIYDRKEQEVSFWHFVAIDLIHDNQIIDFRNRLVQAYDSRDNSIIWAILKLHLKPLQKEILWLYG